MTSDDTYDKTVNLFIVFACKPGERIDTYSRLSKIVYEDVMRQLNAKQGIINLKNHQ